MSKLRVVPYRDLRKLAERCGFVWQRCQGSHNTFAHPDGRVIVIPNHGSKDIVRPLLRKIIRDIGLTPQQYQQLLDE
jgi:predicted RNA binding protein YcfA (HicA-like mRNA interferase family)